jgi:hypothetical protein
MAGGERNPETDLAGAWLAGLILGGLTGLTTVSFALGVLGLPILVGSVAVILWKGPRAIALAGFVTGIGLVWSVLIASSTISCLTIDRGPGRWCEPADGVWRFLVAGATMLVLGLVLSAEAFKRRRRRP